ncbi:MULTISPECIES: threonine ammonia-lyase IlvA [unclassified Paenibacillus]|uniref:threonine ammonia-lyase IlvA n=1 Tax=unclassified Paenibacillus TaxID=185978 RepID=UPI0024070802|nr:MULTISPECIES: threonine ammonia-lyase IlvA [unclassified Paenibacillus]MDF9844613.1 threonine dehydratase [Paenibacillus sp. PastF-2]MDF9851209.1 threonine dehydratase [Paenibacillus sp. PastM-2]MDF9857798.1 threonine dehydratase [Paenibacillus sp. PastF-1]MDH6483058.1 threonine dehydratase [Paenibacillus sp. PastH-2]MDH6510478.1 threonine dehydratase [Paenibacillus sp. PastM-3]
MRDGEDRIVGMEDIVRAHHVLREVIVRTPLQLDAVLSAKYGCNVYLKREDLQIVRSFKIRGAYNMIRSLSAEDRAKGIVCASAGNHAQGVAYSCKALGIKGKVFMPSTTPNQKIKQVRRFGGEFVEVILKGDTFDDAYDEALQACIDHSMTLIHPFDEPRIIAGNGTIAMEVMENLDKPADFVFVTIGGGGLAAGVATYVKTVSPATKVIGVEPSGAASMSEAIERGEVVTLNEINKFVDGAAVKRVGGLTYDICARHLDDVVKVPEGKACTTILELYNENAIVVEPAGSLPIAALDMYGDQIRGKTVVCIVSGGNNDIDRMQEIKERSLIYEGLKHYFMINFPQRAGALKEFLAEVLGPDDDITRFEYTKKNDKENGPALVGIELFQREDYEPLIERMKQKGVDYTEINKEPNLFNMLI